MELVLDRLCMVIFLKIWNWRVIAKNGKSGHSRDQRQFLAQDISFDLIMHNLQFLAQDISFDLIIHNLLIT
jgi:hypothetical protein